MPTLIVVYNNETVVEFPLRPHIKSKYSIGRASDNDICLLDKEASNRHAHIIIKDNIVILEDLLSTNGTFVNGKKIARKNLAYHDQIQIGKHVILFSHDKKYNMGWKRSPTPQQQQILDSHTSFITKEYTVYMDKYKMDSKHYIYAVVSIILLLLTLIAIFLLKV